MTEIEPMHIMLGGMWAVFTAVLVWHLGLTAVDITYITLADGRKHRRQIPFLFRLLLPWAKKMHWLTRRIKKDSKKQIQDQLIMAGYETLVTPNDIISLKFLSPVVAGTTFCVAVYYVFNSLPGNFANALMERYWIVCLLMLMFFYIYPLAWMRSAIKRRHKSIERALPFVLDLLTLSVEAGLDLMTGLKRIIEKRTMDPLGEELLRVFREIQVGKSRREALRSMSERIKHQDIKSLVGAMSQADELGVSMGTILRVQSEQMRIRRFQRAEKLANQAPVKMLFPLVCFIFPAVFMVLLGPIFIELMKKGF